MTSEHRPGPETGLSNEAADSETRRLTPPPPPPLPPRGGYASSDSNGAHPSDPDATLYFPVAHAAPASSDPAETPTQYLPRTPHPIAYDEYGRPIARDAEEASDDGNGAPPVLVDNAPPIEPPPQHRNTRAASGFALEVIKTLVLAAVIFLGVRALVQNFKVEGSSMYPSFLDGEYMLVNRAVYARIDLNWVHKVLPFVDPGDNPKRYIFHGPQRGDVIVFVPPALSGADSKDFIKRVIGVPGDTIDFHDGHVYVNGQQVVEPYITQRTDCPGQFCHVTLQKDQYFVMGDNRTNSSDSRFWGPVTADKIIGKALLSYWCSGPQCKSHFDHVGLAPNHSPVLAPSGTNP